LTDVTVTAFPGNGNNQIICFVL